MQDRLTIRNTERSAPLIAKIEEIAKMRNFGKVTPALLDILELGLKSYSAGYRLIDGKLALISDSTSIVNIEREVAKSLYGQLVGSLVDLSRYEESKPQPNSQRLNFYLLACRALRREQSNFCRFTNAEVEEKQNNLTSPVLKALRSVSTPLERETIILKYTDKFNQLIESTGVKA